MWLEEVDEILRACVPYYLLVVLFIIVSPINPVAASHEFPVYRLQHYDLHGVAHGCRSAVVNLEVRSLLNWSTSRHCIISKVHELTVDHFRNVRSKAGALLVILSSNITALSADERQHLQMLENVMLAHEVSIPIYFVIENDQLNDIVGELAASSFDDAKHTSSATKVMFTSVTANGYQLAIHAKTPQSRSDVKIATIHGHLIGYAVDNTLPTIALVAHYDSFGMAPELAYGADSNGSGVAMLFELVRLFAHLYSDPKTHGMYNIVFILSGAGKFNYQGSKKWLEEQLDSLDGSIIQQAAYIMCLDTLAATNSIYMHVSKPPKEDSAAAVFLRNLKFYADNMQTVVEGVHKKINLADDLLAWEHERFSIRRLPAFTLSSLKSHKDVHRGTILDTRQNLNMDNLHRNTEIIANALAKSIYNISDGYIFGDSIKVERSSLENWINHLGSQPRSAQILSYKDNALIHLFKDTFSKYLHDVKITYAAPDKRDPDFVFYDVTKSTMNIYSVKPAFFDLILTFGIVAYLGIAYLVIQQFSLFYNIASGKPKDC